MKPLLPLLSCSLLLTFPLLAQENNNGGLLFFTSKTPGGNCTVRVSSMVSVSMHEYVVDGAARVYEVNIDTTGNALIRYYYIEPIRLQSPIGLGQSAIDKLEDLKNEAQSRLGLEEVARKVAKSYPTSTHAHTVEYRIDSRENLTKIYDAAERALRTRASATVEIK